jgi:sugar O-acyltransferase (sialic acid O-acetyltransferase NeuD family)
MESVLGIYGAGGFGREIMTIAISGGKVMDLQGNPINFKEFFFIETEPIIDNINQVHLVSEKYFTTIANKRLYFTVAIANSLVREKISNRMTSAGIEPCTIQDNSSIVHVSSSFDVGAIFSYQSIITANSRIGKFFHANLRSYVAHDCNIGDFVTFAPGATCNGNVKIGNYTYIGANATIKQGSINNPLNIGDNVLIGMGSVVTKDVPNDVVVAGNPARILRRNDY